jgi:VanZ family protein
MPLRELVETWLPPLALMAVIFALSAQSNLDSGLGLIDLIGRKIVHAGTYALLCALWWRALRTLWPNGPALGTALAIAVLYAISDEYHQSFVAGRHGSPVDVGIDTLGAAAARNE